ncbi:hypothetical protein VTK73DRAFT_1092 [Phialemonium thermophilum]|uniref:DUF4440 domain-containing protein n=1 Tax=Phialemonium thermophilum TaxID=223376 RepID=A0ABR3VTY6_9PEZI
MPVALGLTNKSGGGGNVSNTNDKGENKFSSSSNRLSGNNNNRLDTISKRNHAAAIEAETLLWRALCDSPEAAKEYLAEDCIMVNPLFAGTDQPLSKSTSPSLDKILDACGRPWIAYKFHGQPLVVEVDLMAVALVYRLSLFRQSRNGKGLKEVQATASSAWRQTAGADWLLCAMHVAYAEGDEDEE